MCEHCPSGPASLISGLCICRLAQVEQISLSAQEGWLTPMEEADATAEHQSELTLASVPFMLRAKGCALPLTPLILCSCLQLAHTHTLRYHSAVPGRLRTPVALQLGAGRKIVQVRVHVLAAHHEAAAPGAEAGALHLPLLAEGLALLQLVAVPEARLRQGMLRQ